MRKALTLVIAAIMWLASTAAPAQDFDAGLDMIRAVSPMGGFPPFGQRCNRWQLAGICSAEGFPPQITLTVRHHWPAAYIEVFRGFEDSILFRNPLASRANSGSRSKSGGTFDVRIWYLTQEGRRLFSAGASECGHCGAGAYFADNYVEHAARLSGLTGCPFNSGDAARSLAYGRLLENAKGGYWKLVYDTTADTVHWSTGCRDLLYAACKAPTVMASCGLRGLPSDTANGLLNQIDNVTGAICGIGGRYPGADRQTCISSWGPLYPRQNTGHGGSTPVMAALAGLRALHMSVIGTRTLGLRFDYQNGMIQAVYPAMQSNCARVGDPNFASYATAGNVGSNDTGRWGFYVWVPVLCCVKPTDISRCAGASFESLIDLGPLQSIFDDLDQ